MKDYIAYCGLDCEKCPARIATVTNDDSMRVKVADEWSKLNGTLITKEMINCVGCRVDGVKFPFCESMCEIRKCAISKEYTTCGSCKNIDKCEKIKMIIENNEGALDVLKNCK